MRRKQVDRGVAIDNAVQALNFAGTRADELAQEADALGSDQFSLDAKLRALQIGVQISQAQMLTCIAESLYALELNSDVRLGSG